MNRTTVRLLSAIGVGGCAALGVVLASQSVRGQSPEIGVARGLQAGVIAAVVFLGAEYARRQGS